MLTTDASMAEQLDKQLWELEDAAFVPHQLWHEDVDAVSDNTVLLGWEEPPAQQHEVLINLQTEVPYCFSRFDRLIEIVDAGQPEPGRNRYQFYRDRGYPLETHKISASTTNARQRLKAL